VDSPVPNPSQSSAAAHRGFEGRPLRYRLSTTHL